MPSDSQWRRDRQHFIQNYAANNGLDEKEALRSQSENHRSKLVNFVDQMCKHGGSVAGADRMSVRAVIGFAEAEWTFTDGLLPTDYNTFQEYLPDDFEALGTEGVHEEVVASILNNLMRFRGYSSADVAIDRFHQEKISLMKCVEQIGWDSVTGELEGVLRSLRKKSSIRSISRSRIAEIACRALPKLFATPCYARFKVTVLHFSRRQGVLLRPSGANGEQSPGHRERVSEATRFQVYEKRTACWPRWAFGLRYMGRPH